MLLAIKSTLLGGKLPRDIDMFLTSVRKLLTVTVCLLKAENLQLKHLDFRYLVMLSTL